MTRSEILQIAKQILFNTDMVRAILDGRKTVTRRVIKCPQHKVYNAACIRGKWYETYNPVDMPQHLIDWYAKEIAVPPYKPGDILYVRETWSEWTGGYLYKAWWEGIAQPGAFSGERWHPSIHMPKEAARIFLRVTGVRVEQLQEITEEQAEKEGANEYLTESKFRVSPVCHFMEIWNSTIPKIDLDRYGWDANPWVWVIEFERIEADE